MAQDLSRPTRGLVLGKFLPPHRGHQFLVDFARNHCDHLTILVCTLPSDPIPGVLRFQWMQRLFASDRVRVVHISHEVPQAPEDHPDFWPIWKKLIHDASPEGLDYFFASEEYGPKTAEVIGGGCQFVPVDQARSLVPVSGTLVRTQPMKYWELLPDIVKPYFLKRVCLVGPESTGKSTLAKGLAREFQTVYAHEYARPLLDPKNGKCDEEDIPKIVRGQIATEEAMAQQANRVLFCDTDVLTTHVWSEVLFGRTPEWIKQLADQRTYDLYLLLDVDVPWADDGQRFFKEQGVRQEMFERFKLALESRGRTYVRIHGDWDSRLRIARDAVKELLAKT